MGEAKAMGAISIVNAIACGKGASVAVNLPTVAEVEVKERKGNWSVTMNGKDVTPSLAVYTARKAIKMLGRDPRGYSGSIRTKTAAPVGVGLKTSSSSSVAITLAVLSAFGERSYNSRDVLLCSASSSLAAGVSVTGAMDDAASCLFGGVNFVDNPEKRVLSSMQLGSPKDVLVRIPKGRSRRAAVSTSYVRRFSKEVESIFDTGRGGAIWKAMTLNGLLFSSIYAYPPYDTLQALENNAAGAGLSGTGPSVAAVFDDMSDAEQLTRLWEKGGAKVIRTKTSDGGATLGL